MVNNQVVMFSPLPPSKTGIADYMAEVGVALEENIEVTYVIADNVSASEYTPRKGSVIRHSDFKKRDELQTLPRVYQMGNNVQHEYILNELLEVPGIVVLHDYSLHHLFAELTLARGDEAGYQYLMSYNYDSYGESLADAPKKLQAMIKYIKSVFLITINKMLC